MGKLSPAPLDAHKHRSIDVIIPFNSDEPYRVKSLEWVKERWKMQLPNAHISVQHDNPKSFNKCRAVNRGAAKGNGRLIIIADADCFITHQTLFRALNRITEKGNHYVYPYKYVDRLSQETTDLYHQSRPDIAPFHSKSDLTKIHKDTGGIILVTRTAFEAVRGMDERFISVFGAESVTFIYSIKTLFKPVNRIQDRLYHLWHPKFPRTKAPEQKANRKLQERYQQCKTPVEMRDFVQIEKPPIK